MELDNDLSYSLLSVLLFFNITNVLLHSFGTYLLLTTYSTTKNEIQMLFLINLSVSEALINLFEIVRCILGMVTVPSSSSKLHESILDYVVIFSFTGISVVYYFVMFFLTFDRLMDIILNIRYPIFWSERKTKILLVVTWSTCITIAIIVSFLYAFKRFDWEKHFFQYFVPTANFSFLILAFTTYGFIFHKYAQAKKNPPFLSSYYKQTHTERTRNQYSAFRLFRKSRFFVSVWLIVTFITFMIVPDLLYLFIGIIQHNRTKGLQITCNISYAISNTLDAIIYIMLDCNVRKELLKKLKFCHDCWSSSRMSNNQHQDVLMQRNDTKMSYIRDENGGEETNTGESESVKL